MLGGEIGTGEQGKPGAEQRVLGAVPGVAVLLAEEISASWCSVKSRSRLRRESHSGARCLDSRAWRAARSASTQVAAGGPSRCPPTLSDQPGAVSFSQARAMRSIELAERVRVSYSRRPMSVWWARGP
jgi:hypothetical protein